MKKKDKPTAADLMLMLASVLDGAEGYVCERGDASPYWHDKTLNDARALVDEWSGRV
jgi:hypothetical protein